MARWRIYLILLRLKQQQQRTIVNERRMICLYGLSSLGRGGDERVQWWIRMKILPTKKWMHYRAVSSHFCSTYNIFGLETSFVLWQRAINAGAPTYQIACAARWKSGIKDPRRWPSVLETVPSSNHRRLISWFCMTKRLDPGVQTGLQSVRWLTRRINSFLGQHDQISPVMGAFWTISSYLRSQSSTQTWSHSIYLFSFDYCHLGQYGPFKRRSRELKQEKTY